MKCVQIRNESIDFEAVLRRHGTISQIKQCAETKLPICRSHLAVIQRAIEANDPINIERLANLLVGTLTDLSPPAALDLALQLERQGRFKMFTEAHQTTRRLQIELDRLQATIANLQ